jgi:hypothetical protein
MEPENEVLSGEEIQDTSSQQEPRPVSPVALDAQGRSAAEVKLSELERETHDLEQKVRDAEQRRRLALSTGIPILLGIVALEAILAEIVFNTLVIRLDPTQVGPLLSVFLGLSWRLSISPFWTDVLRAALRIVPGWVLTMGIAWPIYYFRFRAPLQAARRELRDCEERLQSERLSEPEGRLSYLKEEVRRLSHVTAQVFLDNRERYNQARRWREKAEDILDQGVEGNLGEAQSLISSINELIAREEGELRAQRNWRIAAIGIIVGYIAALVAVALVNVGYDFEMMIPVFGVPLSVAVWAAAGSLAAILYRFYTERGRVRFDLEVRWLIARPVIGIIMGMVSYLAITSGLLLLNASPATNGEGSTIPDRLEVYWAIAFVAGFSSKFYLRIIDLLVERTVGDKDKEKEGGRVAAEGEQEVEPKPGAGEDLAANEGDGGE